MEQQTNIIRQRVCPKMSYGIQSSDPEVMDLEKKLQEVIRNTNTSISCPPRLTFTINGIVDERLNRKIVEVIKDFLIKKGEKADAVISNFIYKGESKLAQPGTGQFEQRMPIR